MTTSLVILLVENDPAAAASYVRQLRRRGHRVDWTPVFQEARYFLSDFAYDVVLLDDEVWERWSVESERWTNAWSLKAECENQGFLPRRVLLMARNERESGQSPDFVKSRDSFVRLVSLVEETPTSATAHPTNDPCKHDIDAIDGFLSEAKTAVLWCEECGAIKVDDSDASWRLPRSRG